MARPLIVYLIHCNWNLSSCFYICVDVRTATRSISGCLLVGSCAAMFFFLPIYSLSMIFLLFFFTFGKSTFFIVAIWAANREKFILCITFAKISNDMGTCRKKVCVNAANAFSNDDDCGNDDDDDNNDHDHVRSCDPTAVTVTVVIIGRKCVYK